MGLLLISKLNRRINFSEGAEEARDPVRSPMFMHRYAPWDFLCCAAVARIHIIWHIIYALGYGAPRRAISPGGANLRSGYVVAHMLGRGDHKNDESPRGELCW